MICAVDKVHVWTLGETSPCYPKAVFAVLWLEVVQQIKEALLPYGVDLKEKGSLRCWRRLRGLYIA